MREIDFVKNTEYNEEYLEWLKGFMGRKTFLRAGKEVSSIPMKQKEDGLHIEINKATGIGKAEYVLVRGTISNPVFDGDKEVWTAHLDGSLVCEADDWMTLVQLCIINETERDLL